MSKHTETDKILKILSNNLNKKDYKIVMDYIYAMSNGVNFNEDGTLHKKMIDVWYRMGTKDRARVSSDDVNTKNNIYKFNVIKGRK
jgi:hypothetical protein